MKDHEWPWYWLRKYVCFWRSEALIKKAIRKAFKLKDFKVQGLHSALLTPLLKCAQKYHTCIFAYWWRIRLYYTDTPAKRQKRKSLRKCVPESLVLLLHLLWDKWYTKICESYSQYLALVFHITKLRGYLIKLYFDDWGVSVFSATSVWRTPTLSRC